MEIAIEKNSKYGLVVSSRVIAKELRKQHKNVLADLDKIFENNRAEISALFIETKYKALNGKMNKEYLLTKDGFTLYMFNIQGYQEFKMAYIRKFNEMEKALEQKKLPLTRNFKESKFYDFRKTYKNEPVMLVTDLVKIANVSDNFIHWLLKDGKKVLKGTNLIKFKKENNNMFGGCKALTIIDYNEAIKVLKKTNTYDEKKKEIEEYFLIKKTEVIENKKLSLEEMVIVLKANEQLENSYQRHYISEQVIKSIMGENIFSTFMNEEEIHIEHNDIGEVKGCYAEVLGSKNFILNNDLTEKEAKDTIYQLLKFIGKETVHIITK